LAVTKHVAFIVGAKNLLLSEKLYDLPRRECGANRTKDGRHSIRQAGGLDPSDTDDTVDWGKVERQTGVKWIFSPTQSQWRNGRAEALVKGTKHSLKTTFKQVDMDFIDFYTTLK
jgi:hypothetical protein